MKSLMFAFVFMAVAVAAGQALAWSGNGWGAGPWWLDGGETPVLTSPAGQICPNGCDQLGLGQGWGDGTAPQPLDGAGFGSPWTH